MAFYMLMMLDEKLLPNRTWNQVLHHRPLIDIDRFATGKDLDSWNATLENLTNNSTGARRTGIGAPTRGSSRS